MTIFARIEHVAGVFRLESASEMPETRSPVNISDITAEAVLAELQRQLGTEERIVRVKELPTYEVLKP